MELPAPEDLLPHRNPFLLLDELTELVPGQKVTGSWTLTGDETFFAGHFPGRPTLPGVLMLESLAQVGACGVLAEPKFAGKLPLFGGASKVRFRRQVVPGETLDLSVELTRLGSRAGKGHGVASVDGEVACEAEIMFVIVDA
jgi:3-hydroxyacyl-[acyl-carrier-protein] dehydratase